MSLAFLVSSSTNPDISSTLQNILANTDRSGLYTYPTDLTREIVPVGFILLCCDTSLRPANTSPFQKGIHSHNDYWRNLPFYTALSVGCVSIEADVWLYNSTLYVGHEPSALTPARTFASLYINPILDVLQRQNPPSAFISTKTTNGVFDGYSTQTLYLFVDVKTPGVEAWPYVVSALEPLRTAGYLSRVESSSSATVTYGPVTVIGTGNTPLGLVQPVAPRDYFYDAPIPILNSSFSNITSIVSPIASTDFAASFGTVQNASGSFNETQLALLRAQIAVAHGKGIKVRYWGQPAWPISVRNGVWKQLWDEGADLINADDVRAAAGFSDYSDYR